MAAKAPEIVGHLSGEEIVALCRKHTIFEWSVQPTVDPIPVARAEGVYFWTPEGKRFLDFNSQLMCTNVGHSHPKVVKAIQEQAATLAYANPFMATEVRARLGAKLAEITPGDIDTFFFTNGGAEAVENAIRVARVVTGRHKILVRYRSYHGGTAGALSLTGDPRRWASEPGIPGVIRAPEFHKYGRKDPETAQHALAEPHLPLVPVIGGDVQESLRGVLDGRNHGRMAVSRAAHRDAGGEIEEAVPIDIPDFCALAMRHHEGIIARIGRRHDERIARQQLARLGSGQIGLDV